MIKPDPSPDMYSDPDDHAILMTSAILIMRQYWIEDLVQEEEVEEGFEFMHEQPMEEHEPYYPEPIEHPILDDNMEEANSLSMEQEAALERLKAEKAERDTRQAEKETHQAILRSEKLKRFKMYSEIRKKKLIDLAQKQGKGWEMAYKTFCGVEDGLEVNDNAAVEMIIQDIRGATQEDRTYFTALRQSLIYRKAGVKANGAWNIIISFMDRGTFVISTKFFEQRTYIELQVMLIKIQRTTKLNELLHEHVKEILMKVRLEDYPNNYLISVEKYLRSTGFLITEKDKAANTLRSYLMENMPYYRKRVERGLEVHPRLPNMPKQNQKDVSIAWVWVGVGQQVEYIGRHIIGAILKPREPLDYPSVIDYQAANSNPVAEEGEIELD
ncbi:hypothetical protein POM88_045483 [Heracleum sosnowskyi]|uniref:Uncharacterized protein n=1 Tax=Heracleum sosnowskyi TaxID=360622 RepID=A0AAD8M633_9APIA|nr:hypothetical protein POM88_045483 [Heracleum sosnowskyi]